VTYRLPVYSNHFNKQRYSVVYVQKRRDRNKCPQTETAQTEKSCTRLNECENGDLEEQGLTITLPAENGSRRTNLCFRKAKIKLNATDNKV